MIVKNLIFLIEYFIIQFELSYYLFPSNTLIYIHDALKPHCYKPDASIFEKEPIEIEFTNPKDEKTYKANLDPKVVMEVLSDDLKVKLGNYKKIDSLQQIIFIEQNKMGVYVHERMGNNWLESKYFEENESVFILDCAVLLKKLYRNVKF
ncbi:MAG: Uma2 family endonuclease [Bacteroidetes bacterium]|nr:MAG: Uma2 family endonuclease [Bacteroidota bacterium]